MPRGKNMNPQRGWQASKKIAKVLRTVVPQTMLLARKKIPKMDPIAFQQEINLSAKGTNQRQRAWIFLMLHHQNLAYVCSCHIFFADQSRKQKS